MLRQPQPQPISSTPEQKWSTGPAYAISLIYSLVVGGGEDVREGREDGRNTETRGSGLVSWAISESLQILSRNIQLRIKDLGFWLIVCLVPCQDGKSIVNYHVISSRAYLRPGHTTEGSSEESPRLGL